MSKFKGGVDEAAKMLQGLTPESQQRVLEDIMHQDPSLAERLKKLMHDPEHLIHMTPSMLMDFLKQCPLDLLARCLKLCSDELKDYFKKSLSKNMKEELEFVIDKKIPKFEAEAAYNQVIEIIQEMTDKGLLVLRPDDEDPLV